MPGMEAVRLTVRCMAWPEDGVWVAACVDLTLAAQGPTLHEARDKLHAQIASYVREAMTVDAQHAEALLSRRAPLWDRLRFAFWSRFNQFTLRRRTIGDRSAGFTPRPKLAYCDRLPLLPA